MGRRLNFAAGTWVAWIGIVGGLGSPLLAQNHSREREVKVTGPGGRTIERRVEIDRGPGYSERQVQIRRPGGTLSRDVRIAGGPAPGFGPGPGPRPGPGYGFGPRPPVILERNVYMGPSTGTAFGLGMLGGAALTAPLWGPPLIAPPPPVVIAPAPVMVAPAPAVVVQQPVVVSAPNQAPAVDPLDGVALAAQRLQSHYPGSRREAAQTLGRLGDPRGIPPLVDALKNDWFKDVRIASAHALGAIGGPEAEAVLERALVYEKKQDVRDAAAAALDMARVKRAAVQVSAPPARIVEESPIRATPRAARPPVAVPPPPTPGTRRPLEWKPSPAADSGDDEPTLNPPADSTPLPPPPPPLVAPEAGG